MRSSRHLTEVNKEPIIRRVSNLLATPLEGSRRAPDPPAPLLLQLQTPTPTIAEPEPPKFNSLISPHWYRFCTEVKCSCGSSLSPGQVICFNYENHPSQCPSHNTQTPHIHSPLPSYHQAQYTQNSPNCTVRPLIIPETLSSSKNIRSYPNRHQSLHCPHYTPSSVHHAHSHYPNPQLNHLQGPPSPHPCTTTLT